jgi:hypothetical protein
MVAVGRKEMGFGEGGGGIGGCGGGEEMDCVFLHFCFWLLHG